MTHPHRPFVDLYYRPEMTAPHATAQCDRPDRIALSPTSGFHHATPSAGGGFCTFSGQVIASVSLYREHGFAGAWIDLDGHFGNSIEDSRRFVPELDEAVPFNLNPRGSHGGYLRDLEAKLEEVGAAVISGRVHYVAFAHGADSHEDDDLGGQCTTDEWLAASRLVYGAIARWGATLGRPVPTALALFGGYRSDDYDFVLSLHAADLAIGLETLAGRPNERFYVRPDGLDPASIEDAIVSWVNELRAHEGLPPLAE